MNADIGDEDQEQLELFFLLLKKLNDDNEVNYDMKRRFEEFFLYKWANDRNSAIDDESEKAMLEQLPSFVQDRIYSSFLFNDFFKK